jgi:tetratricopeptide (TPR) repeat protein
MCKERSERYQSASELTDDIENYLKGTPLIAGPPSTVYRLTKFVRRNRLLVGAVTAVLVVLIGGIIVSMVFAIGQARARAEAERQETIARAVTDYVTNDLLAASGPWGTGGRELTIRLLLDTASESIQSRFGDKPLIEAAIRSMLGQTYRLQGEFDVAERHLEYALHIQQEQLGREHPDTLETTDRLIRLYANQSRYEEAEPLAVTTFEARRRLLGEEHPDTITSMFDLAWVYRGLGWYDEAEPLHVKSLQMMRRLLGEEAPETTVAMKGLGRLYRIQGRYDEAVGLLARALEIDRRVRGEEHPITLDTAHGLAWVYTDQGQYDKAEDLFVKAAEGGARVLGKEHPRTLSAMNGLIKFYEAWGKPEKAKEWRAKLPQTEAVEE